ncbi:MAG: response regulator [Chloroflexota bacterium]|nr:response regulator [Chloroflexota bacterium]
MARDRPPRVLVVDDDQAIRDLLREALEDEGYAVWTTAGPPATADVAALRPDLVLLNHRLRTEETGWDAARRLRAEPATAPIPLLLLTAAVADLRPLAPELAARGIGLLLKPFDLDELLAAVARAAAPAAGAP